jgi:hypothetical protein
MGHRYAVTQCGQRVGRKCTAIANMSEKGSTRRHRYTNGRQDHPYRYRRLKSLQAEAVRSRMQKSKYLHLLLPLLDGADDALQSCPVVKMGGWFTQVDRLPGIQPTSRENVYRSETQRQDRLHLRVPMHRLRDLCEKVSVQFLEARMYSTATVRVIRPY